MDFFKYLFFYFYTYLFYIYFLLFLFSVRILQKLLENNSPNIYAICLTLFHVIHITNSNRRERKLIQGH